MANKKSTPPATLKIEGEMTIFNVAAIKEQLATALQSGNKLEVDLSAVTEYDSAGLQLMVAAKKWADQQEIDLNFNQPSESVLSLLELSEMQALTN